MGRGPISGVQSAKQTELDRLFALSDAPVAEVQKRKLRAQSKGLAECVRVLRPGGQLLVVEADRGCRFNDARAFVSRWRLPKAMRPLRKMYGTASASQPNRCWV